MKNVGKCGKNIKRGQRFFVKALDFLAISLLSICQSYYDQSKDETGSQRKPKPKRESPSLVTAKMVKLWLRERFVQRLRCQTESQHGVSEGSAYDIVKSRPTLVAPTLRGSCLHLSQLSQWWNHNWANSRIQSTQQRTANTSVWLELMETVCAVEAPLVLFFLNLEAGLFSTSDLPFWMLQIPCWCDEHIFNTSTEKKTEQSPSRPRDRIYSQ